MVFRCTTEPRRANRINDEMNRLLSSFFGDTAPATPSRHPGANVWEEDESWVIEMELPGVTPDQVDLSVVGDEVTISVQHPETDQADAAYRHCERHRESFSRTFQLPSAVDSPQAQAALAYGVLTVTLPKAEAARRRKINVATKT